ncbi:MAG: T9SS type A sorting domain-containing protein [Bacteroidetes bacterium]|nr:T9SS type A sorting domain-containing protein [Bacteroidota bacterium]
MKILLVLLLFLYFNINGYLKAQHTFEKVISEPEDQIINSSIEDNDGNYIMAGRIKDIESNLYNGYIIKIDSTGSLLQEETISPNDSISSMFFNIHLFDNQYYILGSQMVVNPDTSKLWFLKLNYNLGIEDEKILNIPIGRWFSYMNSIIDSDTNIVITGYTTRIDETNNYNNDAFLYKLDLDGDSMNSKFYTSLVPWHFSFDIIEKIDSSGYYAFVSHFTNTFGTSGQRLVLDKNLDSLSIDSIPKQVYDYYSPVYINQSDILICGKRGAEPPNDYALNVLSITDNGQLIDYNTFKKNTFREQPSRYKGISKKGNCIYLGGSSNHDYSNPFWSTLDSWFHLIKINPDITPIWEYWYGGDAYYFLYSILATNDGGCIMVGNRYDYETQNQERDIYIVKVNSDGLIVWTQEISIDKQVTEVYPNPGTNQLIIKTDNKKLDFELININGQVVIRQILDENQSPINTESLKSGMYFYRLIDKKNKTIETGKWIKK